VPWDYLEDVLCEGSTVDRGAALVCRGEIKFG
jgi:hypothetical protein